VTTRLVVHMGTHATDWQVTQQQLVSWRRPLERLGVRLCPGDDAESWVKAARDIISPKPSQELVEAATAAVRDEAAAFLVSSEQLEDPLRDAAAVRRLKELADDLDMGLTVMIVVRDQVGYLNELYCDRITHLQMARDFSTFVSAPQPAERFDYASAFHLVTGDSDINVVAVPYTALADGAQGRDVVLAAGLSRDQVDALPAGPTRAALPGPVLIAALRLLFKRVWRLGMPKTLPRQRLVAAARILAQRAEDHSWDSVPFWGWTGAARQEAVLRYRPGNDALAMALWDRPWDDMWESGSHVDVDLAAGRPTQTVDVLDTVDSIVKDLQKAKGAVTTGAVTPGAGAD